MRFPKKSPQAIFVQLTTGCNAKCASCPHPFTYGERRVGNMTSFVWSLLVDQIAREGYRGEVGLYLHHEPLLVKSLAEKIKEINERTAAYVVLSTNGALLNADRRAELIEAKPRRVHINISSASPFQYSQIMKLNWEATRENTRAFLDEAKGKVDVEINVPRLPDVDVGLFKKEFPNAKVNVDSWANSRGGLLKDVSAKSKGSRFKIGGYCRQPDQNLNVLHDGSIIVCCMDWTHQSKASFPSITAANVFETYRGEAMNAIRDEFCKGNYSRFSMCGPCADEMGFRKI